MQKSLKNLVESTIGQDPPTPPPEEALVVSRGGFCIVYKRDISETYINIYNKEWLTVWDANMDLQFCFDFYAIITYSDYYTKDDF